MYMRSKAEIIANEKSGKETIIVTEIPYQVNKARLIERIAELVKEKRLEGISDIRDESAKEEIRIVIELKRGAAPRKVQNQLFKHTQLQTTFGVNALALVDGEPVSSTSIRRAIQQGELEKARHEAEHQAKMEALTAQQQHEAQLTALTQDKHKKRLQIGLAVVFIFLVGGAFFILNETGAIAAGITKLVVLLKGREYLVIPIVMTFFSDELMRFRQA